MLVRTIKLLETNQVAEMIETPSRELYPLSYADIELFTVKLSKYLAKYIHAKSVIGLFLPLGNSRLLPMVIYRSCIEYGATVLRFGNTNIERQLWLINNFEMDIIVSNPGIWRLIKDKNKQKGKCDWFACLTLGKDKKWYDEEELKDAKKIFAELYNAPAFLIQNANESFNCPGYICEVIPQNGCKSEDIKSGQLVITSENIQGFSINSFNTTINAFKIKGSVNQEFYIDFQRQYKEMNDKILQNRLKKVLQGFNINCDMDKKQIGLNSLGMVELLVALEEEFSFSVNIEEINVNDFIAYDSILEFIKRRLKRI